MSDLTLPASVEAVRELPEEIERAMEAFEDAAQEHGWEAGSGSAENTARAANDRRVARNALATAILSRLTAAEASRDAAIQERDRARRGKDEDIAILREVLAENENLRAANMKLQEIVAADDAKAIAEYEWERANTLAKGRDMAATARDAALARVERLEEALRDCVIQIEYEHGKFGGTGSGETVLHRTRALLAEKA